ncbi:MAG: MATE family efflux transporter [Reinekea sp.]
MASHTAQLGTAPIGKLFVSLSMPVILSLLVGGLYNLVDTLFIARGVDALAVGGVAIVFPIQMIIIAIGGTIGNGLASVVTRHIGAGDMDRAQAVTGNAVLLSLLVGVVVMTIVLLTMQPLLRGLGVTEQLWPYAQDYLVVSIWGTPVVLLLSCLNNLARAEGKMHYLTYSILLSSLLNIVLDPIAIYLLHWGVMGVAWATVIAQLVTTLFMLWLFLSNRTQLKISLATLRLNSVITGQIVALGMPTFFSNIGVSVIIGLVNALLGHSGLAEADHLISAYGIVSRIFMFLFFPLLGMMISYQTL